MEKDETDQEVQELHDLLFQVGDRAHMIEVFKREISAWHKRIAEIRVKHQAKKAADAAETPKAA